MLGFRAAFLVVLLIGAVVAQTAEPAPETVKKSTYTADETQDQRSGAKHVQDAQSANLQDNAVPGEETQQIARTVIDNQIQGTGSVVGSMYGNVEGQVVGQVRGTIVGTVKGYVSGTVNGTNAIGSGNPQEDGEQTITGTIHGAAAGIITGTVNGMVSGSMQGEMSGITTGTVNGSFDIVHNAVTLPGGIQDGQAGIPKASVAPGDSGSDGDSTERLRKTVNAVKMSKIWCDIWRSEGCDNCPFSFRGLAANPVLDPSLTDDDKLNAFVLTFTDRVKTGKRSTYKVRCMDEREAADGSTAGRSGFGPIYHYYPPGSEDIPAQLEPIAAAPWVVSHRVLTGNALSIKMAFKSDVNVDELAEGEPDEGAPPEHDEL